MAFWKRREPEPDELRMKNLSDLCAAATALVDLYPENPETQQYLQEVHDWAVRRMIDELE